jgi:hypothetical protein
MTALGHAESSILEIISCDSVGTAFNVPTDAPSRRRKDFIAREMRARCMVRELLRQPATADGLMVQPRTKRLMFRVGPRALTSGERAEV